MRLNPYSLGSAIAWVPIVQRFREFNRRRQPVQLHRIKNKRSSMGYASYDARILKRKLNVSYNFVAWNWFVGSQTFKKSTLSCNMSKTIQIFNHNWIALSYRYCVNEMCDVLNNRWWTTDFVDELITPSLCHVYLFKSRFAHTFSLCAGPIL